MENYDLPLRALAEKLDRKISSTLSRDESKLDIPYLYTLINGARAAVAASLYKEKGRWNPAFLQTFLADYEADLQEDSCFTVFRIPQYISADSMRDGIIYVGARNAKQKYDVVKNPAQLNEYLNHPLLNKKPLALIEGETCRVYSTSVTKIREVEITGIQADPMQLYQYNPDYDAYPIPRDIEDLVLTEAVNSLNPAIFAAQDKLSDGADTSVIRK